MKWSVITDTDTGTEREREEREGGRDPGPLTRMVLGRRFGLTATVFSLAGYLGLYPVSKVLQTVELIIQEGARALGVGPALFWPSHTAMDPQPHGNYKRNGSTDNRVARLRRVQWGLIHRSLPNCCEVVCLVYSSIYPSGGLWLPWCLARRQDHDGGRQHRGSLRR